MKIPQMKNKIVGLVIVLGVIVLALTLIRVPCGGVTTDGGRWDGVCSYGYVLVKELSKQPMLLTNKSWKAYQNNEVPFTFEYPSDWVVVEEMYPSMNFIHLKQPNSNCNLVGSDESIDCEVSFAYTNDSDQIPEENIHDYLNGLKEEEHNRLKNGGLPATPGFHWNYIESADAVFSFGASGSAARVDGFPPETTQYVVLSGGKVIEVTLSSGLDPVGSVGQVLKTIKFK